MARSFNNRQLYATFFCGFLLAMFVLFLVFQNPPGAKAGYYPRTNHTDKTPPSAPGVLTVATPADGEVRLDWSAAEDTASGISGYIIYRAIAPFYNADKNTSEVEMIATPGDVTSFSDTAAIPGELTYYAVSAENGAGMIGHISNLDSTTVPGQQNPHEGFSSNTRLCGNCHRLHEARGRGFLARKGPEIENCYLCHDGTGSNYDIRSTYEDQSAHNSTFATDPATNNSCTSCHDPHDVYVSPQHDETKTIYDWDTKKPEEALCMTCHDETTYSVNGWNIAEQFSMKSRHAVTTETGDGLTGAKTECTSCHGPHTSAGGTEFSEIHSRLSNPFDTTGLWKGTYTGFCLTCHRASGLPEATSTSSTFVPYTVAFPETTSFPFFTGWSKTGYNSAGHKSKYTCQQCHHPHGSNNRNLISSLDTTSYDTSTTISEENLCYQCHTSDGPQGAKDVAAQFAKSSGHPVETTGTHSDTETSSTFAAGSRHAECVDCHDVHNARDGTHSEGTNTVSNVLKGIFGISVENGDAGAEPTYTVASPIAKEYELCFKCHSSYTELPSGNRNTAAEFNPGNPSYHPVEESGVNTGINSAAFTGAWSDGVVMYCSDCHSTNDPVTTITPSGPHGSDYSPLIRDTYSHTDAGQTDLCFTCHTYNVYYNGTAGSRFRINSGDPANQGHEGHISGQGIACYYCHDAHASVTEPHLIRLRTGSEDGITAFQHDSGGGSCKATCHSNPDQFYTYNHAY